MIIHLVADPTAPLGVDVFSLEVAREAIRRGHKARIAKTPAAAGGEEAPEVVLINSLQPQELLAAKRGGQKVALRLLESYSGLDGGENAAIKGLLSSAEILLVPSRHLADLAGSWGAHPALVPFAYDRLPAERAAVVSADVLRPGAFHVVAAGQLAPAARPGFETLLVALALAPKECHLSLIGDGPELDSLKARAEDLRLSKRVSFLGNLTQARMKDFFRAAGAYVDPCGIGGFPVMALHALSEGCPVIGAEAGALPELIAHESNGLLFEPGNPRDLAQTLRDLRGVRGLARRLIEKGIEAVRERTWEKTAAATVTALETLVPA